MKQNIYDNPAFFDGYYELRKNNLGFNEYLEEPAINSLLPDLGGKSVLDLGCGFGFYSNRAIEKGASSYLGIDISEKMISEARKLENERVSFINCAVEDYSFPVKTFDVVLSSVCFHYVKDIFSLFEKISNSLNDRGCVVFSVEHPVCTSLLKGWYGEEGKKHWPVDNYFKEGERRQHWFVDDVVKYHRTIETYVNALLKAGFLIANILEPAPGPEMLEKRQDLMDHFRRPALLVIKGEKR